MAEQEPILIKRYGGTRLYRAAALSYVGEGDLVAMVKRGQRFVVVDATTGEDVTASLTPIVIPHREQRP